jgi:hypothetical protein
MELGLKIEVTDMKIAIHKANISPDMQLCDPVWKFTIFAGISETLYFLLLVMKIAELGLLLSI